jgi:hydrogenase small subunit
MGSERGISRRDFIKISAGSTAAAALLFLSFPAFDDGSRAEAAQAVSEVPVIWLQGGTCTGCSVSALNSLSPKIQNVLVDEVVPGSHISLRYHATVMAAEGELALEAMHDTALKKGGYVLVVEGTVSTKDNGVYCIIGEESGSDLIMLDAVTSLSRDAMAVIALGSCSSYGGIPGASPNVTGVKGVKDILTENGISTPVINVPGCAPHPDWFVGTLATILVGGLSSVEVDSDGRPTLFYGKLIHDNCPRRGHFDAGRFSQKFSDPYCMYKLGCKGPITHADCPVRLWNSGTSWCVGANSLCIGCVEPGFPDRMSPLMSQAQIYNVTPPEWLPPAEEKKSSGFNPGVAAGLGAVAGLAIGAAGVAVAKSREKKPDKPEAES